MVHDGTDVPTGPASLDSVRVRFDERRLVSDAGLLVTATLADRLGIEELVNESVWLGYRVPGAALPGRKVMSLVHGMLAGADSIDDMDVLRAGSTGLVLGHRVMAPSTLGTFLRAFTFGHVRQLDHVLDSSLERAWDAGVGPGDGLPLVIDIDSFIGEVHGEQKQGASYGHTRQLGYHPILAVRSDTGEVLHIRNRKGKANTQRGAVRFVDELLARVRRAGHTGPVVIRADSGFENHKQFTALDRQGVEFSIAVKQSNTIRQLIEQIPEDAWVQVAGYPEGGEAQIAETRLKGWRLIVRRTRLVGAQAELFPDWRHHCFVTNRTVPTLIADIDHRDHATIELVIRDLKDQALAHFPSGRFAANSAWTVIAALAHNLGRWTTHIGLPDRPVQTARSRRRHLLRIPARLTRTGRKWTLRMPDRWPWQNDFTTVLDAIRALPTLT
jgi:Transposase DDE domain group 1